MANIKSAEKRHRQNLRNRVKNKGVKSELRTVIKRAVQQAQSGSLKEAKETARFATRLLDKARVHGVIHKKNAIRNISRLHSKLALLEKSQKTA